MDNLPYNLGLMDKIEIIKLLNFCKIWFGPGWNYDKG